MAKINETDLIINSDGSIYHLGIKPEHVADIVIVVGDPDRVPQVSKYFDIIDFKHRKREFVTHTGYCNSKRITAISSGMGTDNVEILMNELNALANINFSTRVVNKFHKRLNIIRLGTSGSVQNTLAVNTILVSKGAFGIDGLNDFYDAKYSNTADCELLKEKLELRVLPYFCSGSQYLFDLFQKSFGENAQYGNTLTCPGFYAPQGRNGAFTNKIPDFLNIVSSFESTIGGITNLEMETAGYYLFGEIFGHNCLSISAILANRIINQFSEIPDNQIDNLIKTSIDIISKHI